MKAIQTIKTTLTTWWKVVKKTNKLKSLRFLDFTANRVRQ